MSQVANRYSRALFSLLTEAKTTQAVLKDLLALRNLISENKFLESVLKSRRYGKAALTAILEEIVTKGKFHKLTTAFLRVVAHNGRMQALQEIIRTCEVIARHQAGEQVVSVKTAKALSKSEAKELSVMLEECLKKTVILDPVVDESLIGGMRVRVGSLLFDDSYRTKLHKLHHILKGV